jgi:glycosyltransferase involved in cell wall biosynthesis
MCRALTDLGRQVYLFIQSDNKDCKHYLSNNYDLDTPLLNTIIYKPLLKRGNEFFIAICALFKYIRLKKLEKLSCIIISRNVFAAFFFGVVLGKKIIYETHTPESGIIRKGLQGLLLKRQNVETVVISDALKKILVSTYNLKPAADNIHVMHDAAFDDVKCLARHERMIEREIYFPQLNSQYKNYVGYFGHLYPGRGIEVIEGLAKLNDTVLFLVFGGNELDVLRYQQQNTLSNLIFMGHVAPKEVKKTMSLMDVLLMPYQKSVSIGLKFVDTAQWMSPIKMFEYMSTGVPVISSDLPVLKEILIDGHNSLLVEPEDIEGWSAAVVLLLKDEGLATKLANVAHKELSKGYTWNRRAKRMIDILSNE